MMSCNNRDKNVNILLENTYGGITIKNIHIKLESLDVDIMK